MINRILRKIRYFYRGNDVNHFHDYPLGREPQATKEEYMAIWNKAKRKSYPKIDEYENKLQYRINDQWLHQLALHTQVVIKESEICYQHGRLLYAFLSDYVQKNEISTINIIETGTARGFSTLCMAKALQDQKVEGKIVTIDPIPHNMRMYWNCIDDLDSAKSRVELLGDYIDLINRYILFIEGKTEDTLDNIELSRIHFAFLDGAHTYDEVKNEVSYIIKRQKKGDLIFFDDYQEVYFPGIVKVVKELKLNRKYQVLIIKVNDQRGYAIGKKLESKIV